MGVTLSQKIRSCGNNCPPIKINGKARRSFKLKFKREYKRYLIALKFIKLTSMQDNEFCPL